MIFQMNRLLDWLFFGEAVLFSLAALCLNQLFGLNLFLARIKRLDLEIHYPSP